MPPIQANPHRGLSIAVQSPSPLHHRIASSKHGTRPALEHTSILLTHIASGDPPQLASCCAGSAVPMPIPLPRPVQCRVHACTSRLHPPPTTTRGAAPRRFRWASRCSTAGPAAPLRALDASQPAPGPEGAAAAAAAAGLRPKSGVVIVGGGPAGISAALMLAQRGWTGITVLERQSSLTYSEPDRWAPASRRAASPSERGSLRHPGRPPPPNPHLNPPPPPQAGPTCTPSTAAPASCWTAWAWARSWRPLGWTSAPQTSCACSRVARSRCRACPSRTTPRWDTCWPGPLLLRCQRLP
jgi:hypothetical protein